MECGQCTSCCYLPVVPELGKVAHTECQYCATGPSFYGCLIYESKGRPKSCRVFQCAYRQVNVANIAMRPDHSGVMFEKLADDIMVGIVDPRKNKTFNLQGQIKFFLNEGINVVISRKGIPVVYHLDAQAPGEVLKRLAELAGANKRDRCRVLESVFIEN